MPSYPACTACGDLCTDEALVLGERTFHPRCLKCEKCNNPLESLCESDGKFYCLECYKSLFAPKCAGCENPLEGEVLTSDGQRYHAKCFKCDVCKNPIAPGDGFVVKNDQRICTNCRANVCKACANFVPESERCVFDQDVTFHAKCLICVKCNATLSKDTSWVFHKKVYCKQHYEEAKANSVDVSVGCAGCNKPITSQAVKALGKQWHPECFTCRICQTALTAKFFEHDGFPFCMECYQKKFGLSCQACHGVISTKYLVIQGKKYHDYCMKCAVCGEQFRSGQSLFMTGSKASQRVHAGCLSCSTCDRQLTTNDRCHLSKVETKAFCEDCGIGDSSAQDYDLLSQSVLDPDDGKKPETKPETKPQPKKEEKEDAAEYARNLKLIQQIREDEEAKQAGKHALPSNSETAKVEWVGKLDRKTGVLYFLNQRTGDTSDFQPENFSGIVMDNATGNILTKEEANRALEFTKQEEILAERQRKFSNALYKTNVDAEPSKAARKQAMKERQAQRRLSGQSSGHSSLSASPSSSQTNLSQGDKPKRSPLHESTTRLVQDSPSQLAPVSKIDSATKNGEKLSDSSQQSVRENDADSSFHTNPEPVTREPQEKSQGDTAAVEPEEVASEVPVQNGEANTELAEQSVTASDTPEQVEQIMEGEEKPVVADTEPVVQAENTAAPAEPTKGVESNEEANNTSISHPDTKPSPQEPSTPERPEQRSSGGQYHYSPEAMKNTEEAYELRKEERRRERELRRQQEGRTPPGSPNIQRSPEKIGSPDSVNVPYQDLVKDLQIPTRRRKYDLTCVQNYLCDEEFQQVFNMSKEEFNGLQGWKQTQLRKEASLF